MSLQKLLEASEKRGVVSQYESMAARIDNNFENARKLIAFFRQYPDLFVDFIKGPECPFKFLFYQRIFLRVIMRHRYVYATFPRAYSKSFLSMMAQMIRCILYPNAHLFTTTGSKLVVIR